MEWSYETFEKVLSAFLQEGKADDPRELKRKRILGAAAELFRTIGYRKTNIADVAKKAGVAKGTVYLYVKSKEELLVHAVAEEKKRYMGVMAKLLAPDKTPEERLREWIKQVFVLGNEMPLTSKVLSGDPDILAALFHFMDAHKEEQFSEMQLGFIAHLIREAAEVGVLEEGAIVERAKVLLGLAYFAGMLSNDQIRFGLSVEQFAETLAEMLTRGTSAPSAPFETTRLDVVSSGARTKTGPSH